MATSGRYCEEGWAYYDADGTLQGPAGIDPRGMDTYAIIPSGPYVANSCTGHCEGADVAAPVTQGASGLITARLENPPFAQYDWKLTAAVKGGARCAPFFSPLVSLLQTCLLAHARHHPTGFMPPSRLSPRSTTTTGTQDSNSTMFWRNIPDWSINRWDETYYVSLELLDTSDGACNSYSGRALEISLNCACDPQLAAGNGQVCTSAPSSTL
jgi:hypothetical protein